ncbi:HEPN domain-containing protein [Leisingera aquimarina]|uniref:HEPN domain-containing protein n=1 Tax=Leisingera aquimarina TaxID=476529 RepID=UPI0003F97F69|nr:HEPN domain-containing protein [Leisingera aquimarina]
MDPDTNMGRSPNSWYESISEGILPGRGQMALKDVQAPASKAISNAETFLGRKHNELTAFDTLEHFVFRGEDVLDERTFRGLSHNLMIIRAALARELWKAEVYVGVSIVDELVFQAAKNRPGGIVQDVLSFLTTSNAGKPGFVLYPLHGFGIGTATPFQWVGDADAFLHLRSMDVCLAPQTNDFGSTHKLLSKMASRLGVSGKIDASDLAHHTRAGTMDWMTSNPLMMVKLASHTGAYFENQFIYTLKIRISSALTAMLYALAADRGEKVSDFNTTARVNNWETLDIHHYLIGEARKKKSEAVDLRRVPMNLAALDLARLSDLTLSLGADTLRLSFMRDAQRRLTQALKLVEIGHLEHVNTTSKDRVRSKVYARVVTALDWYRQSFSARVTDDEAVVALAVAFETLLTDAYAPGVSARVRKRIRICLKGKHGIDDYVDAVRSIMEARGEIVHNGSTIKEVAVIKAQAAFALCLEDVASRLPNLGRSLDQPVGKMLGEV